MIIEKEADHEREIIELKRKINTDIKNHKGGCKSQERHIIKSAVLMEVPPSVGFESNCSFIYNP